MTCIFSHSFIHYQEESEISLGIQRRGCFEDPSEVWDPNSDIECEDIALTESGENVTNEQHIHDENPLVHPDSETYNRYVMGTRLQTRRKNGKKGGKKQHKLESCKFHDLDLCKQGKKVKTMSQGEFYCHI